MGAGVRVRGRGFLVGARGKASRHGEGGRGREGKSGWNGQGEEKRREGKEGCSPAAVSSSPEGSRGKGMEGKGHALTAHSQDFHLLTQIFYKA